MEIANVSKWTLLNELIKTEIKPFIRNDLFRKTAISKKRLTGRPRQTIIGNK